ncbi:MAG: flagellar basal body rod protein FlgB [Alphaproteobacteria bacterium]
MTIQDIGLFQGISAKLDYLNQRQGVIAQNVANADTPGYRPKDIVNPGFADVLQSYNDKGVKAVSVSTTDAQHIGRVEGNTDGDLRKQKETYEVAPAGNAVIMEEQLLKSGQNSADYNLMLNLMRKQVGMFHIALGSNR